MRPSLRLLQPILALSCAVLTIMSCDERMASVEPQIIQQGAPDTAVHTPQHPSGLPLWDQSPFGVSGIRYDPGQEATGDAVIDSLAANGATTQWVRLTFYWNEIQRQPPFWPDIWYPHGFVEPVARFKRHGIKILGTIEGTAYWATKFYGKDPKYGRNPPDNLETWRKFVQAVVDSFPAVDAWGIWNEPNDTNFFRVAPGQDAALEYARMVAIAAPIVHAAKKPLVVGEIAWDVTTLGQGKTEKDLRDWVARMMRHLTVTFGETAEVLAVHHYGRAEDNIRIPDVSVPLMYAENPDLPWSKWEVWLTEFANATGYKDEGPSADRDIETQLATVFGHITGGSRANPLWKKAFYYNLADTGGGHRNMVGNWEVARAKNAPGLLRYRSPFSLYNEILATRGAVARDRSR